MNIEKRFTKCKNGIKWEVLINNKIRACGITFDNRTFRTLKDKAEYEAICFINWFKETTEYKKLLMEVKV